MESSYIYTYRLVFTACFSLGTPFIANAELFNTEQRHEIMEHYNEIVNGDIPCLEYPTEKVFKAASGMYIYPRRILEKESKASLCAQIEEAYQENKHPIVHEDSITAWGNLAAERYGLKVADIIALEPGKKLELILMDRNVGDYLDGSEPGTRFSPLTDGFSYATYTHKEGLKGELYTQWDTSDFQWEINLASLPDTNGFWGPIPEGVSIDSLNRGVLVGWRGPAITVDDAKKNMPSYFVHYDTWWDDYLPFQTHDFLSISAQELKGVVERCRIQQVAGIGVWLKGVGYNRLQV